MNFIHLLIDKQTMYIPGRSGYAKFGSAYPVWNGFDCDVV